MSFVEDSGKQMLLFTGNSHQELARLVASRMSIRIGQCIVSQKPNQETEVVIAESVRGKDVFILQTGSRDINDAIMELLIMAYACKTSSAKRIVGVIPYMPYSKQCKMRKRGSIVSKLLARMMCKSGLQHVITMDLHQKEIQGFFDVPVDNLRASPFLIQYIQDKIPDCRNAVIVARTPASAKKAQSYAERLRLGIAVIHGEPQAHEYDVDHEDGRHSPPPVDPNNPAELPSVLWSLGDHAGEQVPWASAGLAGAGQVPWTAAAGLPGLSKPTKTENRAEMARGRERRRGDRREGRQSEGSAGCDKENHVSRSSAAWDSGFRKRSVSLGHFDIPLLTAKEKPPINVVGDVAGKIAIIVDDIIDEIEPYIAAAEVLKERGACKVYAMATHGVFSLHSPSVLQDSCIDEVVVTNTVPHESQKLQCPKIKTVDISFILSEAIRRIHYGESMSYLFRHITIDD